MKFVNSLDTRQKSAVAGPSSIALLAQLSLLYIPDYNAWDAWLNAHNVFLQCIHDRCRIHLE